MYEYDALGKRVRKGSTTIYTYSGPNCIAEYATGSAPGSPTQEHVYADQVDSLVMLSRNNDTQHLVATRDQQWSVVSLVNNTNGSVAERYNYDNFGNRTTIASNGVTVLTGSSYDNSYGYTSRRHDDESGLIYFRARFYDPTNGDFTSRDPLEYVDGMSMTRGHFLIGAVDPDGMNVANTSCKKLENSFKDKVNRTYAALGFCGLGVFPRNKSMPYQHCVWQCREALLNSQSHAKQCALLKEAADWTICKIGNKLAESCWDSLSDATKKKISGHCCSAFQKSDFRDNAIGRYCARLPCRGNNNSRIGRAFVEVATSLSGYCPKCCKEMGLSEATVEGPRTGRPFSKHCKKKYLIVELREIQKRFKPGVIISDTNSKPIYRFVD